MAFKEVGWEGVDWIHKNDCGKLLQTWHWTIGLHHMQRKSRLDKGFLASQEGHSSMELVTKLFT